MFKPIRNITPGLIATCQDNKTKKTKTLQYLWAKV